MGQTVHRSSNFDTEGLSSLQYKNIICTIVMFLFLQENVCFSEGSAHNIGLSALAIKDPDCCGFLHKQGRHFKTWKKRYCILKCNQLFYYGEMSETTAYGVMNLTGYRIGSGSEKSGKYYFTAYPPDDSWRTFYFFAESDAERTRYDYSAVSVQFFDSWDFNSGGSKQCRRSVHTRTKSFIFIPLFGVLCCIIFIFHVHVCVLCLYNYSHFIQVSHSQCARHVACLAAMHVCHLQQKSCTSGFVTFSCALVSNFARKSHKPGHFIQLSA